MLTNCLALSNRFWDRARNLWKKIVILSYPLAFDAPVRGFPSEYRHPLWDGNTRMVSLPMVKKFRRYVCSFWRDPRTWRTDGQADGRTDRHCMTAKTALASHRAVKIVYAVNALFISLRLCPREYWTVTDGCDISFLPSTIKRVALLQLYPDISPEQWTYFPDDSNSLFIHIV